MVMKRLVRSFVDVLMLVFSILVWMELVLEVIFYGFDSSFNFSFSGWVDVNFKDVFSFWRVGWFIWFGVVK